MHLYEMDGETEELVGVMKKTTSHQPVLLHETIELLGLERGGCVVDATVGGGGHSLAIAERIGPRGMLVGFDLDGHGLALVKDSLAENESAPRSHFFQTNFSELKESLAGLGIERIDGIVFDLGISSDQLDDASRGFSFSKDGPLDMRMRMTARTTAADIVNHSSREQLENIFWTYGQERHGRHYARIIWATCQEQRLETTGQLRDLIHRNTPSQWRQKLTIDPATRIFQALRIAVNNELENVKQVLPQTLDVLASGGRIAVISFHSLEDGLVKRFFQEESRDCLCPPAMPICQCNHRRRLKVITRHPVYPDQHEIERNPRSRSARLRVAERIQRESFDL